MREGRGRKTRERPTRGPAREASARVVGRRPQHPPGGLDGPEATPRATCDTATAASRRMPAEIGGVRQTHVAENQWIPDQSSRVTSADSVRQPGTARLPPGLFGRPT
ncbi:hypothetical protein BON30_48735 [Cystobacter ferrugineus]|uniref:Uncharacterized protein n=1 Tax=Cystobacter ferrugineus TaxID=83449 RepID=A0A1L9ATU4_9BACT|nr:hypothetical protein BON30_48735 [Cystobacter ferrugineus]